MIKNSNFMAEPKKSKLTPLEVYKPTIIFKIKSFARNKVSFISPEELATDPILIAWWNDLDEQEITLVSSSMGMIRTYTKQYI
jgi:hypothetical protein